MVFQKFETEDAVYIRNKPINETKSYKPDNLIKAVNSMKSGKVSLLKVSKKFQVPVRIIQQHLKNSEGSGGSSDKIYTDETIRKHANVIICKTYAKFQKEFAPSNKLQKMLTKITVSGAAKLDGIEYLRSTLRTNQDGTANSYGLPSRYFPEEEDEEKFIRTILDRLKSNNPMTGFEMRSTARAIAIEKGHNVGMPSRPWIYHIKRKYEPLFYGDQIQIKIEVLDDRGLHQEVSLEKSILRNETSSKPRKQRNDKTQKSCLKNVQLISALNMPTAAKLKLNFCRFCINSTNAAEQRDIPEVFLRIFHCIYEQELEMNEYPNKICGSCHDKFTSFCTYLQGVYDAQSQIRNLLNVKIELEDCPLETKSYSLDNSISPDDFSIKHEPETAMDTCQVQYLEETSDHTSAMFDDFNYVQMKHDVKLREKSAAQQNEFTEPTVAKKTKEIANVAKSTGEFSINEYLKKFTEKQFECDMCGLKTKRKHYIQRHIDRVHLRKIENLQCSICGIICSSKSNYQRHKQNYHSSGDSICDQCGLAAKNPDALRLHIRSHDPKIPCVECGELIGPHKIKHHMRNSHQPMNCKHCEKEFKGRDRLHYHIQYVHEKTDEICSTCQSVFPNKIKLKLHTQRQHPTALFPCPVPNCNYNSSRKPYIKLHLSHHRDIDEIEKGRLIQSLKTLNAISIVS